MFKLTVILPAQLYERVQSIKSVAIMVIIATDLMFCTLSYSCAGIRVSTKNRKNGSASF